MNNHAAFIRALAQKYFPNTHLSAAIWESAAELERLGAIESAAQRFDNAVAEFGLGKPEYTADVYQLLHDLLNPSALESFPGTAITAHTASLVKLGAELTGLMNAAPLEGTSAPELARPFLMLLRQALQSSLDIGSAAMQLADRAQREQASRERMAAGIIEYVKDCPQCSGAGVDIDFEGVQECISCHPLRELIGDHTDYRTVAAVIKPLPPGPLPPEEPEADIDF